MDRRGQLEELLAGGNASEEDVRRAMECLEPFLAAADAGRWSLAVRDDIDAERLRAAADRALGGFVAMRGTEPFTIRETSIVTLEEARQQGWCDRVCGCGTANVPDELDKRLTPSAVIYMRFVRLLNVDSLEPVNNVLGECLFDDLRCAELGDDGGTLAKDWNFAWSAVSDAIFAYAVAVYDGCTEVMGRVRPFLECCSLALPASFLKDAYENLIWLAG
ncbi:hypothetical protein ACFL26_00610 [Patescibacteria group bacterium]